MTGGKNPKVVIVNAPSANVVTSALELKNNLHEIKHSIQADSKILIEDFVGVADLSAIPILKDEILEYRALKENQTPEGMFTGLCPEELIVQQCIPASTLNGYG